MSGQQIARLNLADEIKGAWRHVVVTTYGVDLGFFEQAILPLVPQARARLVLADQPHLLAHQSDSIRDGLVRHWNHGYLATGIAHANAAHSKLILLTSSDRGRLLVGSGNLGVGGWTGVGELFTRYDFAFDHPEQLGAFQGARQFLDLLVATSAVDTFTAAYLSEIWQGTPWLEPTTSDDLPVRHNLETGFLDQLEAEIQRHGLGPIKSLLAMAPFHDPTASTIRTLIDRINPSETTIILQAGHTSADPDALTQLGESHPSASFVDASVPGHPGAYLHAKLIIVDDGETAICLQGSPNLSAVALLESGNTANLEVANLLTGANSDFDHIVEALETEAVEDPSTLAVRVQGFSAPDPGGMPHLRLLAVRWDGENLHLDLRTDIAWSQGDQLSLRVRNDLVTGTVVGTARTGANRTELTMVPSIDLEGLFATATPVALLDPALESNPHEDGGLSNPVYCVNQPALRHLLDARPAHIRMRDIGTLGLAGDEELGALLEALQSTMVIDGATLVAAAAPASRPTDPDDDEAVYIAYSDVDFERLRNDPALRQYLYAGPTEHAVRNQQGLEPLGIQMALRSITDAFKAAVGMGETGTIARTFTSDWSAVEDDEPVGDDSLAEGDVEQDEDHVDDERRWSDEARTRRIWHNFIARYLKGIRSRRWKELVGAWVLAGNYDVFAHILQRLHRQPWRDVGFLLESQVAAHCFVWGDLHQGQEHGESGWLASLSDDERRLVFEGFLERHVPARLLTDVVVAALLTDPRSDTGLQEHQRLDLRIAWRNLAQALLAHPDWMRALKKDPELPDQAIRLVDSLAAADPALDLAGLANLSSVGAFRALADLASYSTRHELRTEVAGILGVQPHDVVISDEELGPVGRQRAAHQITLPPDHRLAAKAAVRAIATWRTRESAAVYRIKAGRSFIEYQEGRPAEWRRTLYDDAVLLDVPEPNPELWAESLELLRVAWAGGRTRAA